MPPFFGNLAPWDGGLNFAGFSSTIGLLGLAAEEAHRLQLVVGVLRKIVREDFVAAEDVSAATRDRAASDATAAGDAIDVHQFSN
jgi:hypothetical protein